MNRTSIAAVIATTIIGSLMYPRDQAAARDSIPPAVVVGTDPSDDFGGDLDPSIQPLGQRAGLELIQASMSMADRKTVNFILHLAELPPSGGVPEGVRYIWSFTVDGGEALDIDGRFTNYIRGICDPFSGQCPPPRDPGPQPFFITANCELSPTGRYHCEEIARVKAVFDVGAATITVPVPLDVIDAKPGSRITGQSVSATFAGFYNIPVAYDELYITRAFRIPRNRHR